MLTYNGQRVKTNQNIRQNTIKEPWHNPSNGINVPSHLLVLVSKLALHSEGLPRTGLSISKHCAIVAQHHLQRLSNERFWQNLFLPPPFYGQDEHQGPPLPILYQNLVRIGYETNYLPLQAGAPQHSCTHESAQSSVQTPCGKASCLPDYLKLFQWWCNLITCQIDKSCCVDCWSPSPSTLSSPSPPQNMFYPTWVTKEVNNKE